MPFPIVCYVASPKEAFMRVVLFDVSQEEVAAALTWSGFPLSGTPSPLVSMLNF